MRWINTACINSTFVFYWNDISISVNCYIRFSFYPIFFTVISLCFFSLSPIYTENLCRPSMRHSQILNIWIKHHRIPFKGPFFIGIIQIRSHILWNSYRYGYHFHNKTPPIRHIYFQYKTFAIFFQVITNYTYRNKSPVPVIRNMEEDKFPLQGGVKSLLQVGVRSRGTRGLIPRQPTCSRLMHLFLDRGRYLK